jgi:hypothetical protein
MNAATEFEALTITRERSDSIERSQPWHYQDDNEDEGVRRRFDSFLASLGKLIEKQGPTQPSDLL